MTFPGRLQATCFVPSLACGVSVVRADILA
jgi:hypothetical protein